jgi:hypothetical protein
MIYLIVYLVFTLALYWLVGFRKIWKRILMFRNGKYWTDYNVIEFCAWMAKAIIIVPGLIFGVELWYMHFLTLITSSLLIWASMRKDLPTLIVFNTIWIVISLTIITRNLINIIG